MDRWLDPLPLCHGNSPQIIFNNMRRDSLTGSPAALASRGLSGPSGAPPALSSAGCARCPPAAQGSEQGTASACFVEWGGGSGREGTEGPQGTNWGLPKPPLALPDSAPQSEALVALLSSSTPAHRAVMPCNLPAARVVSAGSHRQPLHHLCARFSAKHCAHPASPSSADPPPTAALKQPGRHGNTLAQSAIPSELGPGEAKRE